jgi:hypothetical protein
MPIEGVAAKAFMTSIDHPVTWRTIRTRARLGGWVGARSAGLRDITQSDAVAEAAVKAVMELFTAWGAEDDDPAPSGPAVEVTAMTAYVPDLVYRSVGLTHRHALPGPAWQQHEHLGGGMPHEHDPETGGQVPVAAIEFEPAGKLGLRQVLTIAEEAMASEGVPGLVRERVINRMIYGHPDGATAVVMSEMTVPFELGDPAALADLKATLGMEP